MSADYNFIVLIRGRKFFSPRADAGITDFFKMEPVAHEPFREAKQGVRPRPASLFCRFPPAKFKAVVYI